MAIIIDGKSIAKSYKDKIKIFIDNRLSKKLKVPCIATILVGNDGGSIFYVRNQNKLCEKLRIKTVSKFLNEDIEQKQLVEIIEELNNDKNIDGIILMLPIPKHLDEKYITSKICPDKDIDGLTDINSGRFYKGQKSFIPCTPKGIIELIKSTECNIEGKNAVVIGRSNIVGKPIAQLLLQENATVTIVHSKTKNIKNICKTADILVVAIGKPKYVTDEFIKEGAIVIDVGTSMVNGKMVGDVDFDKAKQKAGYITPVPGGVGSMTTTMLLKNVCEALE